MKRVVILITVCLLAAAGADTPVQSAARPAGSGAIASPKSIPEAWRLLNQLKRGRRGIPVSPPASAVATPESPSSALLDRYPTLLVTPDPGRTYVLSTVMPDPDVTYTMPQIGIQEFSSQSRVPAPETRVLRPPDVKQEAPPEEGAPQAPPDKGTDPDESPPARK